MLGAALSEVAMTDFRAALGLGTAVADCSIRDPETQAAGLLCALRAGQVSSPITFPVAVQDVHFCMDAASRNISIWVDGPPPHATWPKRRGTGKCVCAKIQGLHLHFNQHTFCPVMQGRIKWPSSASDKGLMVSADFGALALWASQRRLCLALSLLAAAKDAAMKLAIGSSSRPRQRMVSTHIHSALPGPGPVYGQAH